MSISSSPPALAVPQHRIRAGLQYEVVPVAFADETLRCPQNDSLIASASHSLRCFGIQKLTTTPLGDPFTY